MLTLTDCTGTKHGFGVPIYEMIRVAEESFVQKKAGDSEPSPWDKWSDAGWVKQMLQDEGFKNVHVSKVIHTASLDSADHVVQLATESSPMLDMSKVPPEKLANARQAFKEALGLRYDSACMLLTACNIFLARLRLDP